MIQIATGDNSPVAILLFQFTRHLRDNLPMFFAQNRAVQKLLYEIPTFHFLNLLQHFDRLCDLLVNPVFRAFQVERLRLHCQFQFAFLALHELFPVLVRRQL